MTKKGVQDILLRTLAPPGFVAPGSNRPITGPNLVRSPSPSNVAAVTQDNLSTADTYKDVSSTADTVRFRFPPPLDSGIWHSLRSRFEGYLRVANVGDPPQNFVDFKVTKEESRLVQSVTRRLIELEVDPERLSKLFHQMYEHLKSDDPQVRKFSASILIRLANAHLDFNAPHLEETFDAAYEFFKRSHAQGFIDDRHAAAKIMTFTNPYLPKEFPKAYEAAKLLRAAVIEQWWDIIDVMRAYGGLIHCFLPYDVEVAEGKATFGGIIQSRATEEIQAFAREVFYELVEHNRE